MSDTPYTLKAMALAQAYRTADYASLDATREALLTHLRAAQAAPANFNVAWDREIANNNGVQIGADYRHWMLIGWRAAQAVPEARWCKHCGETTVAGLCRSPEPVGHEARRRAYQEGHRDGEAQARAEALEQAAKFVEENRLISGGNGPNFSFGWAEAVEASALGIREILMKPKRATKPAQEGDHV